MSDFKEMFELNDEQIEEIFDVLEKSEVILILTRMI